MLNYEGFSNDILNLMENTIYWNHICPLLTDKFFL